MDGESLFLANLEVIERLTRTIAARHHLRIEEIEDFESFVKLKFIDDEYKVLRLFHGNTHLHTYLTTVISSLALEHMIQRHGKWRPSEVARRLGRVAQQLETLINRDGYSTVEAVEVLRTNFKVEESREQLHVLADQIPRRTPRSFIDEQVLENLTSTADTDYTILTRERAARVRLMEATLAKALSRLSDVDRHILRMRFENGLSLEKVAQAVNIELRALYKKFNTILKMLRSTIEREGLRAEDVVDLLAQWEESGVLSDKSPWALYHDAEPSESVAIIVQNITADLIAHVKKNPEELYSLKPRQFEELIAEILASYGWHVELTRATRDGGYDIFAISKDPSGLQASWLIECKKYKKERKVGVGVVRALYGTRGVVPGGMLMLATTSYFSKDVYVWKESKYDLQLRDCEAILEWINAYHPNPTGRLYIKDSQLVLAKPGDEFGRVIQREHRRSTPSRRRGRPS
jgi:RNA polymerase sigma factor (sigma-70 family)